MKTIPAMLTSTTLVLAFGNGAQAEDKPAIVRRPTPLSLRQRRPMTPWAWSSNSTEHRGSGDFARSHPEPVVAAERRQFAATGAWPGGCANHRGSRTHPGRSLATVGIERLAAQRRRATRRRVRQRDGSGHGWPDRQCDDRQRACARPDCRARRGADTVAPDQHVAGTDYGLRFEQHRARIIALDGQPFVEPFDPEDGGCCSVRRCEPTSSLT